LVTVVDDDETAATTAASLSSGSGASGAEPLSSAGVAGSGERLLTLAEVSAISRFIECRYPAKPERKAVPTLHLAAILVVRDPCSPTVPHDAFSDLTAGSDSVAAAGLVGKASASETRCASGSDDDSGGIRVWLHKGGLSTYATQAAAARPSSAADIGSPDDSDVLVLDNGSCGASSAVPTLDNAAKSAAAAGAAVKRSRAASAATAAAGTLSAGSTLGGLGGLLKDQWQPLVLPVSALLDENLPGDNWATISATSSVGAAAAKRPRVSENGVAAGSEKASAPSAKGAHAKAAIPRSAAGRAAADAANACDEDEDEDEVSVPAAAPPTIDVAAPRALAAIASSLAAAGLISSSHYHDSFGSAAAGAALLPASSSCSSLAAVTAVAGGVDAAGWRVRHCGTLTHVFSHVIHKLQVLAVHFQTPQGSADSFAAAALRCATSAAVGIPLAAGARVPSVVTPSASTRAGATEDGPGVGRWVRPAEFGEIGLTTWAAKLLYAALLGAETAAGGGGNSTSGEAAGAAMPTTSARGASKAKAKGRAASRATAAAAKAPERGSAVVGVGAGVGAAALSPADAAGLELLRKRWRTSHGKLV
jgi:hypothetical protein